MPCLYCMYAYSCRPNISTSPSEKRKTGPNLTLNMCLVIYGSLEFSKIDENLLIYGISVVCTLGTSSYPGWIKVSTCGNYPHIVSHLYQISHLACV